MSSVKKEKNFEIFEMSKTDIGQVFSIEKENFNFPWSQRIFLMIVLIMDIYVKLYVTTKKLLDTQYHQRSH